MPDDGSIADFESFVTRQGWQCETREHGGYKLFIFPEYVVVNGRDAGKKITIGVLVPKDYPSTPPKPIHVKRGSTLEGSYPQRIGGELGADWEYWSRQITVWTHGRRISRQYFDLVDRWLESG